MNIVLTISKYFQNTWVVFVLEQSNLFCRQKMYFLGFWSFFFGPLPPSLRLRLGQNILFPQIAFDSYAYQQKEEECKDQEGQIWDSQKPLFRENILKKYSTKQNSWKDLTMSGAQFFEEGSATDSSTGLRGAHISLHIVHIHKQPLVLKLVIIPESNHSLTICLMSLRLDRCDSGCWRCQRITCWRCSCFWYLWWG